MVFLLSLLSFMSVAAGAFGIALGVPVRETWLGAALLMAGSVAVTGGFILVGLAAVLRELRQVVLGSKPPLSGMPRPVRPLERRDVERVDDADRQTAPRMPMPAAFGADARDIVPAKLDVPDTHERWRKPTPEEWSLRAVAASDSPQRYTNTALPPIDDRPRDIQPVSHSWPRPTTAPPAEYGETEMRRTPVVSSRDIISPEMFEAMWPSEPRNAEEGPGQRTEPPPEAGMRPAESKSPPLAPAQPPASASTRPMRAEPRPSSILKTGVIQQMAYTLFTDGSIEMKATEGVMRFGSVEEFLGHLEKSDG